VKFTVIWVLTALNELATLWTEADSALRKVLTAAVQQIDEKLEREPQAVGESRDGSERIGFMHPLGFRFEVDVPGKVVHVLQVWVYGRV